VGGDLHSNRSHRDYGICSEAQARNLAPRNYRKEGLSLVGKMAIAGLLAVEAGSCENGCIVG